MLRPPPMTSETLGSIYALLTAFSWGVAVVLFKRSGDAMDPLALNMFKNVVGLSLMVLTWLVQASDASAVSVTDYAALALSGAVGIGAADTMLFVGLNILGASRQAIVDCLYSPAVVVCSFLMLGEVLTPTDALGAGLILAAVLLVVLQRGRPQDRPERILTGIAYSAGSVVLMAIAIVAVKPIVERLDVVVSTTARMAGGVASLALVALPSRRLRSSLKVAFTPSPAWRFALPGALIGTYLALLFWIAGFKYAPASVAAILNQTSTLFIVVLAALFLRERMSGRVIAAVLMAFAGSLVVML